MLHKFFFFALLIVLPAALLNGEVPKISFDRLARGEQSHELNGERVEVRGFFYRSSEGRYVLAPQPDLKLCCIGSAKEVKNQIVLLGDIPEISMQRAVSLRGVFAVEPLYGEGGELAGLYSLKDIELVEGSNGAFFAIASFSILLLILIAFMYCSASKKMSDTKFKNCFNKS